MSFAQILNWSTWLSPIILFFGVGLCFNNYKQLDAKYRVLSWYLVLGLVVDLLSRLMVEIWGNNLILIPVFGILELMVFSWLYLNLLLTKRLVLLRLITLVALAFMIVDTILVARAPAGNFQSFGRTLDGVMILLFSLAYLVEKLEGEGAGNRSEWNFNLLVLFFFSLNALIFLPLNFLLFVESTVKFYFWLVNFILTIAFYILLISWIWNNGIRRKQLQAG